MHRSVRINLHPLSYKISVTVYNGYIVISCTGNTRKLGDLRFDRRNGVKIIIYTYLQGVSNKFGHVSRLSNICISKQRNKFE